MTGGEGFSVKGGVKPGAGATLTIEVAIDIFIAKVGIGGELHIVQADAPAVATWKPDNTGNPFAFDLSLTLRCTHTCVHACVRV